MQGFQLILAWFIEIVALAALLFIGPGWVLVWELRQGRTMPIRVERATHPGRYWLCIAAHVGLWLLWILVWLAVILVFVVIPGLEN